MPVRFRHAICNEVYEKWDFAAQCKSIKKIGYDGIEIAPFTLAEDPATVPWARRREVRDIIRSEGLEFVGLHWLMVSPKGLHVTTPDAALREKSWLHIRNLIDLCADLGTGGILVFGSPKQRGSTGGLTRAEAMKHYEDGLASVAPHAEDRGVTILAESLSSHDCDVMNTLEEATGIVRRIASPGVQTMFDVHNSADETMPHADLVERYLPHIRHIHVNEMDGKHPGQGDYDFRPLLERLIEVGYARWVSLEAFDFSFGSERIASESLAHLKRIIAEIEA